MTPGAVSRSASVATPSGVRLARQITAPATDHRRVAAAAPLVQHRAAQVERMPRPVLGLDAAVRPWRPVPDAAVGAPDPAGEAGAIVMRSPYAPPPTPRAITVVSAPHPRPRSRTVRSAGGRRAQKRSGEGVPWP